MIEIDENFLQNNKNLFKHKKCVFIVGAGISVPSGIPDFRSNTGIFQNIKKELKITGNQFFSVDFGLKEKNRKNYLKYILDIKEVCDKAKPNLVHYFMSNFPKSRIYTQNIDGLEEKAGVVFNYENNTQGVYLHGNLNYVNCTYCGYKKAFNKVIFKKIKKTMEHIKCNKCLLRNLKNKNKRKKPVGILHPNIIHYHQFHPDEDFIKKTLLKDSDCDLLIVIGTSLKIEGIKNIIRKFAKFVDKKFYVDVNKPNKNMEKCFDYFYQGNCEDLIKYLNNENNNFIEKPDVNNKNIDFSFIENSIDDSKLNESILEINRSHLTLDSYDYSEDLSKNKIIRKSSINFKFLNK